MLSKFSRYYGITGYTVLTTTDSVLTIYTTHTEREEEEGGGKEGTSGVITAAPGRSGVVSSAPCVVDVEQGGKKRKKRDGDSPQPLSPITSAMVELRSVRTDRFPTGF